MRRSLLIILVLILSTATFDTGVAAELPASAYIQGLVGHPQSYSLSCESRSAVDWAAYWGVYVSESEFLANLPRSDNPDAGFVGNPDHAWGSIPPYSYGVHAKPVATLLRQYGLQAKAYHNMSWKSLRREIAAGHPVIVWVIGQMISGYPVEYTARNGHKTTVAHFEHTMIVVGYEPGLVHVVDAYTGLPQTYRKETFMASWGVLGHMAVTGSAEPQPEPNPVSSSTNATDVKVVLRLPVVYQRATGLQTQSTPAPAPVPEPAQPDTYIVKPGDYLAALGQRFNLDWYDLAVLNGISYPYIIYTGQVLRLH